jgi:hypothetical protein
VAVALNNLAMVLDDAAQISLATVNVPGAAHH